MTGAHRGDGHHHGDGPRQHDGPHNGQHNGSRHDGSHHDGQHGGSLHDRPRDPDDPFLGIDLDRVRLARDRFREMAETFGKQGPTMAAIADELEPSWTGPASRKIRAEMSAMGTNVTTFGHRFEHAADAIQDFIDAVRRYRDEVYAPYHRALQGFADDYELEKQQARKLLHDNPDLLHSRLAEIHKNNHDRWQSAADDFRQQQETLRHESRRLGRRLGDLTMVHVPEKVARHWLKAGGNGHHMSWREDGRPYPPDLDANGHLPGMHLSQQKERQEKGDAAGRGVLAAVHEPGHARTLAATVHAHRLDGSFRQGFVSGVELHQVHDLHGYAGLTVDESTRPALTQLVADTGHMLADATNPEHHADATQATGRLVDAYTGYPDAQVAAHGHVQLAELVHHSTAHGAEWHPAALAAIDHSAKLHEEAHGTTGQRFDWAAASEGASFIDPDAADAIVGSIGRHQAPAT